MTCGYCQFANAKDDHRCLRCGRRLEGGEKTGAGVDYGRSMARSQGANALALSPAVAATAPSAVALKRPNHAAAVRAREVSPREISMDTAATLDGSRKTRASRPAQPSLFGAELQPKIIPFEMLPRVAAQLEAVSLADLEVGPEPANAAPSRLGRKPVSKPAARRTPLTDDSQATLDFLPPMKTPNRPVKTAAEPVIFCNDAVAPPHHRAAAAALDAGMIALGFGIVITVFRWMGNPIAFDRPALAMLGAMLGLVALLYGLLFAVSGAVTPGMKWTHLRLITFDGFPLDPRGRAIRFLGSWMSVLSGGIGLVWALLDEEALTWHDHMSKSFPTLQESTSNVVRYGRQ